MLLLVLIRHEKKSGDLIHHPIAVARITAKEIA